MGTSNGRSAEDVRRDIAAERDQLASAVEDLRSGLGEATDKLLLLDTFGHRFSFSRPAGLRPISLIQAATRALET